MGILHALYGKNEVVTRGDFRDAVFALKTRRIKLTCQWVSRFAGWIEDRSRTCIDYRFSGSRAATPGEARCGNSGPQAAHRMPITGTSSAESWPGPDSMMIVAGL